MRDTADRSVSGVQGRLRNLGYHPGGVDGTMGPHTADAIREFQRTHGLEPTGAIDGALLRKLEVRHRA